MTLNIFFPLFLYFLIICCTNEIWCLVYRDTKLGRIKGVSMVTRNGHKFDAFLGLPYAEPPVGTLRFKGPVPITRNTITDDTFDATKPSPPCTQFIGHQIIGQEDCLYLNLYRSNKNYKSSHALPVWVFIYGGKKEFGDASPQKYGPHYIMDKPVILITFSYRMGVMGFLSTEDDAIGGNFGAKDQSAVLRWIQNNIADFGGDPSNVTLTGGSSGAIDVGLHLFSPLSKGLFHRAISQSGQPINTEVIHRPGSALKLSWRLASMVGCSAPEIRTSENLLQCFQSIPVNKLITESSHLRHDYILPFIVFRTVLESKHTAGAFVINHPCDDLRTKTSVPWILGSIKDEGSQRSLTLYSKKKYVTHFEQNQQQLLPLLFRFGERPGKNDHVLELIREKYELNESLENSFYKIAQIYSYSNFHLGVIETAFRYKSPLFLYCYDYDNNYAYLKTYLLALKQTTKYKIGAVHGEELTSLFFNELIYPPVLTGPDRIVSDQVLDLWYNFVAFGNPNGYLPSNKRVWKNTSKSKLEYLHINNLTVIMKENYFMGEEYRFWKRIGSPTICDQISKESSKLL